jgi:predicted dehydrogenase
MTQLGIGIVGGGYMGKAHAVAMSAVGAVFETKLRPRLEMVCATSEASAEKYRTAYGFARATTDWRTLVNDPLVDRPGSTLKPEKPKNLTNKLVL